MDIILIAAFFLLFFALVGYLLYLDIKTIIYLTIIMLFFPIHIQFMGKDAFTTGTICIFILYLKYLLDAIHSKKFIKEKYDLFLYLLIIAGALSIVLPVYNGTMEKAHIGPAVRGYFNFFSSLLFVLVIKNYKGESYGSGERGYIPDIEKLLNLIVILITIHIIISISVKFVPSIGSYFKIFLTRDVDVFDSVNRTKIERIGSFVFGPESYGEFLAVLCPFVLYKIYKRANFIWILCLSLFILGLLFSVTRSGILLFILAFSVTTIYCYRINLSKSIISLLVIVISLLMLTAAYPQIFDALYTRFYDIGSTYKHGGSVFEITNRDLLPDVIYLVTHSISFFGNGITEYNFHNLYLTTVYKNGIIGATLFFLVLMYPAVCLLKTFNKCKTIEDRTLIFVCLTSIFLFFINELKYEFNRSASYQQLCWGFIAILYLMHKSIEKKQNTYTQYNKFQFFE